MLFDYPAKRQAQSGVQANREPPFMSAAFREAAG
jgi:hypothetical protein